MRDLVTGEAVALDLRTAALPSRVVAAALDVVVQAVLLLVVGGLFAVSSVDLDPAVSASLTIVLLVAVLAGYPVVAETLWRGRTLGKWAMGLRVVRDDGGPVGFRQALVRGLAAAFLEKPGVTLFVLPVVVSLLNRRDKRLGDLLAGTVVLQERLPSRPDDVLVMPPPLAGWAAGLELSRLPDPLALSARQFVARAGQLTPAAREDLGSRLVAAVAAVTAPPPPPGTPGWAFLAAVLAERTRRETLRLRAAAPGPQPRPPGPPGPPGAPEPAAPAAPPAPRAPGGFAPPG